MMEGLGNDAHVSSRSWTLNLFLSYLKLRNKKYVGIFVDFKKAYDSIDRNTLFKILKEMGSVNKTRALTQQTSTFTTSRVKLRGDISDPSQWKPVLGRETDSRLYCLPKKVISECHKQMRNENVENGVKMVCKSVEIAIDSLAFADDLTNFSDYVETATKQISQIKTQ